MDAKPSKLWNLALVVSLFILAAACYYKAVPFRTFVDDKCPYIKEQLAKRGWVIGDSKPAVAAVSAQVEPSPTATPASVSATPEPTPSATPAVQPLVPEPTPQGKMDIAHLATDQSLWPKKVVLKKETTFPAVMNRKKVGELNLPAGTEVMLIQVRADKVAVAYTPTGSMENAGGAMIPPEDTDVLDRANAARH